MPKNGQNDLKFGHNMHYGILIIYKKIIKIYQKIMIFWPKNQ